MSAFLVEQVDLGAVEAAGGGLDHLAFLARAVVDAARAVPAANGGARSVHLGVDGRVVRDADRLRLVALADAIEAAPVGEGATIAVAVVDARTAVSPPGDAGAVVALGRSEVRPVARPAPGDEWAIAVRKAADLTVTFDPDRVGATDAAELLAHVRQALEERDWVAER